MRQDFLTCFLLPTEINIDSLRTTLDDICERDETFRYKFYRLRDKLVLVVFSPDKNTAFRRGIWLRSRVRELRGKVFWVK